MSNLSQIQNHKAGKILTPTQPPLTLINHLTQIRTIWITNKKRHLDVGLTLFDITLLSKKDNATIRHRACPKNKSGKGNSLKNLGNI